MKPKDRTDERIPMFVESPRGDDKMGTDPAGNLVSDHVANETGTPFEVGVPKPQIQEAVEKQLVDDKWVVLEKKDGSSELLTRKDIPEPEKVKEEDVPEEKHVEEKKTGDVEGAGAGEDDWRKVFSAVPVKQKPEQKPEPKAEPKSGENAVKPAVTPIVKPACTAEQKKEKETWKSKFENIKSATATHKGKGG